MPPKPAAVRFFPRPVLRPIGDGAVRVQLGEGIDPRLHRRVRAASLLLARAALEGVVECVPTYAGVTVFYDPRSTRLERLARAIEATLARVEETTLPAMDVVTLPVLYGGERGPDLDSVAASHRMSPAEVVEEHGRPTYLVHMIGFSPGFPYLGGLPERLATPRLETPRVSVPAGSVGIGGSQTGVYPLETPGGWRILGRTPVRLFDPSSPTPNLLEAGDRVRFRAIGEREYQEIEDRVARGIFGVEREPFREE